MKINLKGTKKNPLSKQLKELKKAINNNVTKNVTSKSVALQKEVLHEYGEEVVSAFESGGVGKLPRGPFGSRSGDFASSARYSVYASTAKKGFPESTITFSLAETSSKSYPGTEPDFEQFHPKGTKGNVPFSKRKNKKKGGAGYNYGKAIEYGNKFMRRNSKGYRDITGRLYFKGYHAFDATIQYLYQSLLDKYEQRQTKILESSLKYLERKNK